MLQIVIPAFNEERRLPRTLRELRRHVITHRGLFGHVEVIVVDNASTDRTAEVARAADSAALRVRVLRCDRRGKGAAVRAGLLATDADLVCFMDADGATGLDALQSAWARLQHGADVVIGSRALSGSRTEVRHCRTRSAGAAVYRRMASRLLSDIADTQCGFKVFTGEAVRAVIADLRATGFSFDVELLVRLRAQGARIEEIAVDWVDVPGSTFVPSRHGAGAFAELACIAWRVRELPGVRAGGRRADGRRSGAPVPRPVALSAKIAAVPMVAIAAADLRKGSGR